MENVYRNARLENSRFRQIAKRNALKRETWSHRLNSKYVATSPGAGDVICKIYLK